jgi:hypothetical protein
MPESLPYAACTPRPIGRGYTQERGLVWREVGMHVAVTVLFPSRIAAPLGPVSGVSSQTIYKLIEANNSNR